MTTRWWAPAKPQVGPDAFDLQLLEPGDQPKLDLANSLVALHRVGAAACEASRDEDSLVQNLIAARAAFAPRVVESVSKSVGEGPYAGLLVRDVADEAEACALDLYRAAVAKGVTPTLAAQRVGAVFGVPAGELGTYRTLACTPAASPVAIADAADRVLFGYVEKVCTEEVEDSPLELVSKETEERTKIKVPSAVRVPSATQKPKVPSATLQDDPNTPYHDARDEGGRFASAASRLRGLAPGTGSAPIEVGTTPANRQERRHRLKRRSRTSAAPQTRAERQTATRARAERKRPGRRLAERSKILAAARQEDDHLEEEGVQGTAAWLERIDDYDRAYGTLKEDTVLHLSQSEWAKLVKNARGDGTAMGQRIFRLGHLEAAVSAAGKPVLLDDTDGIEEKALGAKVEEMSVTDHFTTDITAKYISREQYNDPDQRDSARRRVAEEHVLDFLQIPEGSKEAERLIGELAPQVVFRSDFQGRSLADGGRYAVLFDTEDAPTLKIRQITVKNAKGLRNEYGDLELDPNQLVEIKRNPAQQFDAASGIEIESYEVTVLADGGATDVGRFLKADDPATPYWDHREGGRFATLDRKVPRGVLVPSAVMAERPVEEPVEEAGTERRQRIQRRKRVQRVQRTQARPIERVGRQKAERKRATREVMDRRLADRIAEIAAKTWPPDYGLTKGHDYVVMSADGMASLLEAHHWEEGDESITLRKVTRMGLIDMKGPVDDTRERVAQYIGDDAAYFRSQYEDKGVSKITDLEGLEASVVDIFLENPHLQQVYIEQLDDVPANPQLLIMGHAGTMEPTHLIEIDPEFDRDYVGELLDEGVRQGQKLDWVKIYEPRTDQKKLRGYYVTRPLLHRWRLVNADDIPPGRQTDPRHNDPERG